MSANTHAGCRGDFLQLSRALEPSGGVLVQDEKTYSRQSHTPCTCSYRHVPELPFAVGGGSVSVWCRPKSMSGLICNAALSVSKSGTSCKTAWTRSENAMPGCPLNWWYTVQHSRVSEAVPSLSFRGGEGVHSTVGTCQALA